MKKVAYTEYAVEIHSSDLRRPFVKQLDVFDSYEAAEAFYNSYSEPLGKDEELSIIFIDYDENDNEIAFGPVC